MLLYNWDKIVKISKGNVGDIITILRIITNILNIHFEWGGAFNRNGDQIEG